MESEWDPKTIISSTNLEAQVLRVILQNIRIAFEGSAT